MDKPAIPANLPAEKRTLANVALNGSLAAIDQIVRDTSNDVAVQMGVLMMAQALAFRRLRAQHKITTGAQKKYVLKRALADFEEKIRKFGFADEIAIDHKL